VRASSGYYVIKNISVNLKTLEIFREMKFKIGRTSIGFTGDYML